jgi:hypothetical protein
MSGDDWPSESGARSQDPRSYRAPDSASFPGRQPPVPPEWDDDPEEFPAGAEEQDTEALAGLSEVAAFLASVPAPVLPDAVEARISAALAAEVIARAGGPARSDAPVPTGTSAPSGAASSADAASTVGVPSPAGAASPAGDTRTLGPAPARARVRRRRSDGGRRGFHVRPKAAIWSAIGCLVLAGIGVGLSLGSSPTYSGSSGLSAAGSSSAVSAAAAAPEASAPAPTGSSSASSASSASASSAAAPFAGTAPFTVTASGTKYEAATLAAQVRAQLHVSRPGTSTGTGSTAANEASTPAAALRGCVTRVTGGLPPRLVDRATYQGNPAYIIASSSRVWVVRPGCTAANSELITSVSLAG